MKARLAGEGVAPFVQHHCFEQQRAFIQDPSKRKAALCGRRAGKTYGIACYLLKEAIENPGVLCAYVALTRISAKRILWPELQNLCHRFDIRGHFNHTELTLELDNGSKIWLSGASDASEIEKFRGSKYRLVALDEAASFKTHIEQLIFEVFEPALIDLDGTMCMIGTPSAACAGAFFDITSDIKKGWAVHHWTIFDNPHIPHARTWITGMMQENGWEEDNPIYRREWLGEWVRSQEGLVYKFNADRNLYDTLPEDQEYHHIIGVDLGYDDATAIVVTAFSYQSPVFYVVEDYAKSGMIPSDIARKLKDLQNEYEPVRIMVDTGGLGKAIAEEFSQRYGINVTPAEKKNKHDYIELMNSDMLAGRIKVPTFSEIPEEWRHLVWDVESSKKKEDERFDNHLADACLYAWRESRHFLFRKPRKQPKPGTPEYIDMKEQEIIDQLEEEELERQEFMDPYELYDL